MLKLPLPLLYLLTTLSLTAFLPAQAQIAPALGDPTNTRVNLTGNTFNITGGAQAGANLFHSFQRFGLNQGQIASFLANPSIHNILGRVVGGEASVIDGLIRVTGSNANLFLMNPAGIVFGRNARLDVPGSFTATTGSAIGVGNGWFNAVGSNDYAALVGTPNSFVMPPSQPGAIVNSGNLTAGQSLTLVGGTVINTGTLSAPEGTVTIAAVPGENLVRVSQEGNVLSLDLPVETRAVLNPLPFVPQTLPQLLTGSASGNATGVTIANGVVSLTGSGVRVENGDVLAKGVTAQTATLAARNNVTLVESQITTAADLNLLAQNTVQIKDSPTGVLSIRAGRDLTIQGDRSIAIAALNHPDSKLVSGNNMVLRSASPIQGDAHYIAGGNLQFERLDQTPGDLISPSDPIILARGDVFLSGYTGASLHILAGGSVTLGNVNIDNTVAPLPTLANTINDNPASPYQNLAPIRHADGTPFYVNPTPTLDAAGNVQRDPTSGTPLVVNGLNPTLDVRAGIDWAKLGGLPGDVTVGSIVPAPTLTPPPSNSANITITSIRVTGISTGATNQTGNIILTNQYYPNTTLTGGTIQVIGLVPGGFGNPSIVCSNCSFTNSNTGSGAIVVDSRSNISLGNIQAFSGANVVLSAASNITTGQIFAQGPLSGTGSVPLRTSVVLNSATGNIRVSSIDAGANGIDIQAAGVFQAVGVFNANFLFNQPSDPFIQPSSAGTPLGNFLISKGVSPLPPQTFVAFDSSFAQNTSLLARTNSDTITPITIRYGDGSRLLINDTLRSATGVNRIVVRGGNAGFYSGPQVAGKLVPGSDPYVSNPAFGVYAPITNANFNSNGALGRVFRNEQYAPLSFGSLSFPADASGTVGGISFSGINATLYGAILGRAFPAVANPGGGGNGGTGDGSTGGGGGGGIGGDTIIGRANEQTIQRQLTNPRQDVACNPSVTIASVPSNRTTRSEGGALDTGTASTPCVPVANNDAQILKILDEPPRP
jgi:filamentous hemagglutinin family protein